MVMVELHDPVVREDEGVERYTSPAPSQFNIRKPKSPNTTVHEGLTLPHPQCRTLQPYSHMAMIDFPSAEIGIR